MSATSSSVTEVAGRYAVVDTGRHKVIYERADGTPASTHRLVRLVRDDGTAVDLGVRPEQEMQALAGTRVVVRGRFVAASPPSGPGAQPDPSDALVDIESVVPIDR